MLKKFDIAVLGNGSLSKSFIEMTKHDVTVYAKPDIDYKLPSALNDCLLQLIKHDVIINTIGVNKGSTADMLQINYLTPVYILEKLIDLDYKGKVIYIGSHGSTWTSWPGIDIERLNYNVSKANLKTYMISLSQSGLAKYRLCLFDSTKFQSPMSDFQGDDIREVTGLLEQIVDLDNPKILHIETY